MGSADLLWTELIEHAQAVGPDPALAGLDDDQLETELRTQAAVVAAATCRWLEYVAEFVVRGIWDRQGARTPAHWLSWATGVSSSTAREQVRVALRLRELPQTRARFAAGTLSYSKVRAITRMADEHSERIFLNLADAAPAAELDRVVSNLRRYGPSKLDPVEQAARRRGLWWRHEADESSVMVRLPVEQALLLESLLDRAVEAFTADQPGEDALQWDEHRPGVDDPLAVRRLDALVYGLQVAIAQGPTDTSGLDRTTMVLHVDADALAADATEQDAGASAEAPRRRSRRRVGVMSGRGRTAAMSPKVLRRLACDATLVLLETDDAGNPDEAGRKTRKLTAAQRRTLHARDRCCRFPGCGATWHLQAHHIVHWADEGPTVLENLVLLCGFHHRFVHDHGWTVAHDGAGRFAFHPPGEDALPTAGRLEGASAEAAYAEMLVVDRYGLQPPDWDGDPPDYAWIHETVSYALMQLKQPAPEEVAVAA